MTAFIKIRTFLSIAIALTPCIQAFATIPSHRPARFGTRPSIVGHEMVAHSGLRDALRSKRVLIRLEALALWKERAPVVNNAHKTYLQAFKASTLSEKLKAFHKT